MDPTVLGTRLASSLIAPLLKKLFRQEPPGAGLVDKPVRLSALVSFRGAKRTLTETDVRHLAAHLVREAVDSPGERPFPSDEETAVIDAVTRKLVALGDLEMDDVQAVRLGYRELARKLHYHAPSPAYLSSDSSYFLDTLTEWACLHIINFFTRQSTFVARTLVTQSRDLDELVAKLDELITRSPRLDARDAAFERRYLSYVAKKHGKLLIYGIDLVNSPGKWPLDTAYLSLEATAPESLVEDSALLDELRSKVEAAFNGANRLKSVRLRQLPLPADEALADHDRVLLRGEAGSGKTTLVQWLAVSAARHDLDGRMAYLCDRIPFVLPLRTLTRHGERLPAPANFLPAVGAPLIGEQPPGWESRVLATGRALVLIDGIDEVPEGERARARAWIGDLIDTYPGNRWLVTSRPSAVREEWLAEEDFTELTLAPMRPDDVAAFIGRWHTAARTGAYEEDEALTSYEAQLLNAVRAKADLGRLATNPLMCGLLCALHRDRRGFLPIGRKELYEAALTMLLARRDRERGMPGPELREEPQLQILQRLAYWLIKDGRTEMSRERALAEITKALPALPEMAALGDAEAVLTHLLNRSGLLRTPSRGTIDFCHRTFQDFLGARALLDDGTFGMVRKHAADDQWEDVIRMAVAQGRPRDRADILRALLRDTSARAHLLAASCLDQATELDPSVRAEIESRVSFLLPPTTLESTHELATVGPLILDLLPGPEDLDDVEAAEKARLCVITASRIGTDAAIAYLSRFSRYPSWQVRGQLAWSWHRFDTERYGREVIAHLSHEDLYLIAHSAAELSVLRDMGGRPWMQLEGDFTAGALLTGLDPDQLTRLDLRGSITDMSVLARFPLLEVVYITACPNDAPLTGLQDLPRLTRLGLTAQHARLAAQAGLRLPQVSTLYVYDLGTDSQLEPLPDAFPSLTQLNVLIRPGHSGRVNREHLRALFPHASIRSSDETRQELKHE
ncbi:NACHT domain-containing protein [Streptomyces sp. NPDC050982]|uniref:NACHT domain-containing protein n=1 Tax=Streptomyces sp. NPDC050982 TaxID=3154746 RepID=UPI0033FD5905